MNTSGLTAGDLALLRDNDGMFGGNGVWPIFLFFLLAWGGNGLGFGGRNGVGEAVATNADIQRGFDTNTIINKLDGLSNGLCDGFYSQNTTMLQGFNGLNTAIKDSAYSTQTGIANLGYQMQQCCCETNRNIDAVRYENAKNTCDIINAGNANTQRIVDTINTYVMEQKDSKIAEQGQLLSEQRIIAAMKPQAPIPAYTVPSPYASYYGATNCCGCNSLY